MAKITLNHISPELLRQLKKRAVLQQRSLNEEAVACLEETVRRMPTDVDTFLKRVRALRKQVRGQVDPGALVGLRNEGRL